MGTFHRLVGRPIRDEGRTYEVVANEVTQEKGSKITTIGETGKFDKTDVPRMAPPSGTAIDNNGANS